MERFGVKCLILALVSLVLAMCIACDDEEKVVCCKCVCYRVIDPNLNTIEKKTLYLQDKGLNCRSACSEECNIIQSETEAHYTIDCDAKKDDTDQ